MAYLPAGIILPIDSAGPTGDIINLISNPVFETAFNASTGVVSFNIKFDVKKAKYIPPDDIDDSTLGPNHQAHLAFTASDKVAPTSYKLTLNDVDPDPSDKTVECLFSFLVDTGKVGGAGVPVAEGEKNAKNQRI